MPSKYRFSEAYFLKASEFVTGFDFSQHTKATSLFSDFASSKYSSIVACGRGHCCVVMAPQIREKQKINTVKMNTAELFFI